MRILLATFCLICVSSCGLGQDNNTTISQTGSTTTSGSTVQKAAPTSVEDGAYVSAYYTLRIGSSTGEIYETNFPAASATGSSPTLDFMIGAGSMIPGFEQGIMGMKKGEKKTIEVPPELGYGKDPTLATVHISEVAPKFTVTRDKKMFEDIITETVKKSDMQESMRTAAVGQYLTGANGISAKVMKITDTEMTLEVKNPQNIFSGKPLTVGTITNLPDDSGTAKITAIKGTGVTIEVINKKSPFYNKKFTVGESAAITGPNNRDEGRIEIRAMSGETIDIAQYSATTGKTLFFDVEIVDIIGGSASKNPVAKPDYEIQNEELETRKDNAVYSDEEISKIRSICGDKDIECMSLISDLHTTLTAYYSDTESYPSNLVKLTEKAYYNFDIKKLELFNSKFSYKRVNLKSEDAILYQIMKR